MHDLAILPGSEARISFQSKSSMLLSAVLTCPIPTTSNPTYSPKATSNATSHLIKNQTKDYPHSYQF
jgi:hypothetical protein